MEKESKKRMVRGDFVGTTRLGGVIYNVFIDKGHFSLSIAGKFIKYVKRSVLRVSGIFFLNKKIYGHFGFVGAPKI